MSVGPQREDEAYDVFISYRQQDTGQGLGTTRTYEPTCPELPTG
jgi:hypothetical protein